MQPGLLSTRAEFQRREAVETDLGGTREEWVPQFTAWAGVKYLRGGEAVMQARLASRNPVVLTIRNSTAARQVTAEWRAVIRDRSGIVRECEIKESPRPAENGALLEMLAEG